MWPYWIIFLAVSLVAATTGVKATNTAQARFVWTLSFFVLVSVIGFRNEVGGDWTSYQRAFDALRGLPLSEATSFGDPAYQFLSWLFSDWADGLIMVNAICGAIFTLGLVTFCRSLPRPWLALATAIPYMVIVVAMGYTRQSVALGCWMLGLVALKRGRWPWFVAWVLLGATFHKSAVVLLPFPMLLVQRNRWTSALAIGAVCAVGYAALLQDSVDSLYTNYVEAQYQSQGALVRLLMSVVPAVIFLVLRDRVRLPAMELNLWRWLSIISLALLPILFATPSSTAVDRVALYLLPLQLVVFSHAPDLLRFASRSVITLAVLLYFCLVQFVWLNFAYHAIAWLPYKLDTGGLLL